MTADPGWTRRSRYFVLAALSLGALGVAGGYYWRAQARSGGKGLSRHVSYPVGSLVQSAAPTVLAEIRSRPHLAFRNYQPGPNAGKLAFVSLADPSGPRASTDLPCSRVHAGGGTLFCVSVESDPLRPLRAYLLDASFTVRKTFGSPGLPSRARVSADGRLAAYTAFVGGDSYAAAGFSTRTRLVRVDTGITLADLETFTAWKDGQEFRSADFNYWGVTFTRDAAQFYATLGTGGHTYLVRGDIASKRIEVVADGVECPSLSPDETRLAFKRKIGDGLWRPAIFSLATAQVAMLPEHRNLDDQIEWLDNERVLYGLKDSTLPSADASIWMIPADGSREPQLFVPHAESPVVIRPGA